MSLMSKLESDHEYVKPKREILGPGDMTKWSKSAAYVELVDFITKLNTAVTGKKTPTSITESPNLTAVIGVLNKFSEWIDETPPIDQPQRFGNKAFKTWYQLVNDRIQDVFRSALEEKYFSALGEITVYLVESFGNSTRIDYGSGHEMNFVLFLYCLFQVGILDWMNADDKLGAVLGIFDTYMILVRKLQMTYRMEPAGSHGAWSLDDYQFIPFVWGSAQLIGHDKMQPTHMTDRTYVERYKSDYMFLGCIDYILQVKTGPFHEHSNQLWDISGIETWSKVNSGLIKMYKGEVLAKFPIIQHTLFGSLISINPAPPGSAPSFPIPGPFRNPPPGYITQQPKSNHHSESVSSLDNSDSTSSCLTEGRSNSTGESTSEISSSSPGVSSVSSDSSTK